MITIPVAGTPPKRKYLVIIFSLAAIFLGLIVGLAAAMGLIVPIFLTVGAAVIGILIFVIATTFRWSIAQIAFLLLFIMYYLYNLIESRFRLPIFTYWEFAELFVGLWGLNGLAATITQSKLFVSSILAFAGFLGFAIVSSFIEGNSHRLAAIFQLFSDFKLLLVLGFGIYMAAHLKLESILSRSLTPLILIMLLFLFLQWWAPTVYLFLFNLTNLGTESTDLLPSPGLSIFAHPSILAAATAALAIFTFTQWQVMGKSSGYLRLKFFALVFLLIASNQRQEIFAFLLVIIAIYVLAGTKGMGRRLLASIVIFATLILIYLAVYAQTFEREAALWGINSVEAATHPRALLYDGAESLARTYFPLGSGLGTFGGVGSSKYDLSLYYKLGMSREWWWSDHDSYLLDTYWPNSIAESGAIGASLLLLHYVLFSAYLFLKAAKASTNDVRLAWLWSAGSFTWVLFNSPTSPAFQELLLLFFPGLFFGIAVVRENKEKMRLGRT